VKSFRFAVARLCGNRPVLVLPAPGARTGTGVSSPCRTSDPPMTSHRSTSTSGAMAAAVAPTQPASVEVSRVIGGALSRMVHTNLRLRLRLSKKVQLTGELCKPCS